jgi:hypothetical protein
MNFAFILRVLLLAAAFAIPFLEPEKWSGVFGAKLGYFIFVGFVFLGSMAFSLFGGCMRVFFSQRRDLPRPSLSAPIFFGRSPLQFFWFAGMLSLSVGVGAIVRHLAHAVSFEGWYRVWNCNDEGWSRGEILVSIPSSFRRSRSRAI